MKLLTAKYKGKCYACDALIKKGDTVWWTKTAGRKHADCAEAAKKLADEAVAIEKRVTHLGDFGQVYGLFNMAAMQHPEPRITIDADGFKFFLYMSAYGDKLPNMLIVKSYSVWYGRITPGGLWYQYHNEVDERMADALSKLAMDPEEAVAMYGRMSGVCCFCTHKLIDKSSVSVGYDENCAKRWGLKYLWPNPVHNPHNGKMSELLAAIDNYSEDSQAISEKPYCISCDDEEKIDGVPCPGYHTGEKTIFEMVLEDAAAPKETVTLTTKMVTAKVNLPEYYS